MQQLELGNSDLGETNFVVIEDDKSYPTKSENLKNKSGRFFQEFRGETSQYTESGKTLISKTQQVFHVKSIFDELELVMRISTSSKTPHG